VTEAPTGPPTGAVPALDGHEPADVSTESALCACGHLSEAHDPIAARYCAATIAGRLQRGCWCEEASGPSPRY
jgi:hypothetical protein